MNKPGATVFVVDDDEAIRSGLSMLLRSYGYDCAVFASGLAFLDHCSGGLPDRRMAILDLSMPVMDGLELQAELVRRGIDMPVVFVSGDGDVPLAVNAMQHGAIDFIEKPVNSDILLDRVAEAIQAGASNDTDQWDQSDMRSRLASLTRREREVLEGIAAGGTSKVIASDLGISERTVELHRSRVLKKMAVRNSTELLNYALPALESFKRHGN
jgi:FixJ family two-component response regulator